MPSNPTSIQYPSYDAMVKAQKAGAEARRKLSDAGLSPWTLGMIRDFEATGLPATKKTVAKFLNDRGTSGAIDGEVATIIRWQATAKAAKVV